MTRFIRPLATLVVFLLVAGGAGLLLRARGADEGTLHVTAYFEKAIGLFANSDVNILGVPVGKVTAVEPVGTRVKVSMEISDRYPVPADARAQIVPISVISDRYVQLFPPYESGPALPDGAVLDVDRTQIPAELDDVFKQLKKLLDAIEPGQEGEPGALGELIVQLNETLADREDDLRGTLVNAATLTGTLAGAEDNLSNILINLSDLFTTLSERATHFSSLNSNFALIMAALAESKDDLEGTLVNLADMTTEVGDLVRDHREDLGRDIEIGVRILRTIIDNRGSVEEALNWLPAVGTGVSNAYHGGEFKSVDVRDNAAGRLDCGVLDPIPPGPVRDALEQICEDAGAASPATAGPLASPATGLLGELLSCDEGIRKVKKQIRRILRIDSLPADLVDELVKPMKKNIRRLDRKCDRLGRGLRGQDALLELLRERLGTQEIDEVTDPIEVGNLMGSAAGGAVTGSPSSSLLDGIGSFLGGFLGFLGWSS